MNTHTLKFYAILEDNALHEFKKCQKHNVDADDCIYDTLVDIYKAHKFTKFLVAVHDSNNGTSCFIQYRIKFAAPVKVTFMGREVAYDKETQAYDFFDVFQDCGSYAQAEVGTVQIRSSKFSTEPINVRQMYFKNVPELPTELLFNLMASYALLEDPKNVVYTSPSGITITPEISEDISVIRVFNFGSEV